MQVVVSVVGFRELRRLAAGSSGQRISATLHSTDRIGDVHRHSLSTRRLLRPVPRAASEIPVRIEHDLSTPRTDRAVTGANPGAHPTPHL